LPSVAFFALTFFSPFPKKWADFGGGGESY